MSVSAIRCRSLSTESVRYTVEMSTYGYSAFTRSKMSAAVMWPEAWRSEVRIIIRCGVILWPVSRSKSTVSVSQPIACILYCNWLQLLYAYIIEGSNTTLKAS